MTDQNVIAAKANDLVEQALASTRKTIAELERFLNPVGVTLDAWPFVVARESGYGLTALVMIKNDPASDTCEFNFSGTTPTTASQWSRVNAHRVLEIAVAAMKDDTEATYTVMSKREFFERQLQIHRELIKTIQSIGRLAA